MKPARRTSINQESSKSKITNTKTTALIAGGRSSKLTITHGSRRQLSEWVIRKFLKEEPGTGKRELASRYTYFVETLTDGRRIYLTRPTRLKGFDFEIRVEGVNFAIGKKRSTNRPSHAAVYDDLAKKKAENRKAYSELFDLIEHIYSCAVDVKSDDHSHLTFSSGMPVDMVLKIIKWFFIEQDVTYWNYSGRAMFMSGVPRPK